MLTSDELRHADKSQRWHRNHSGDELVADAARLSSPPIPRKSHLRRAGWDYGGVDGRDRVARRQSGTLLRVTVGVVGQAGLSPDSPSVRGLGFPARHRAATSAPSCRSCPNRALSESCTSPSFARSADHIRSHSCIPPLYKHLYKHHRRLTRPTCITFFEREKCSGASPGASAKPIPPAWLVPWKTGSAWPPNGR